MIFVAVGTQFPFDRLIKAIDKVCDDGLINEKVFAQIGDSNYKASNIETINYLDKNAFDEHVKNASCLISHAGMGIISMALEYNKPLIVMPRLSKYGEVVNNHQLDLTEKFEELGHLLAAYNEDQLPDKIKQLRTFTPKTRKAEPKKVTERIAEYLASLK